MLSSSSIVCRFDVWIQVSFNKSMYLHVYWTIIYISLLCMSLFRFNKCWSIFSVSAPFVPFGANYKLHLSTLHILLQRLCWLLLDYFGTWLNQIMLHSCSFIFSPPPKRCQRLWMVTLWFFSSWARQMCMGGMHAAFVLFVLPLRSV
jgi:hypothetical protein